MSFKAKIKQNAVAITRLHARVRETLARRDESEQGATSWKDACSEFRAQYDELAFPGGTADIRARLRSGDQEAIEYAIDFIEVRPYFFRSGYLFKDFLRVLKNCPLSDNQRGRYDHVKERYNEYRMSRHYKQS